MRVRSVFYSFWRKRYNDEGAVCDQIVPAHLLTRSTGAVNDPYNLWLFPAGLKDVRSQRKLASAVKPWMRPLSCRNGTIIGYIDETRFVPPAGLRGLFARGCNYVVTTYPEVGDIVHARFMSPCLMVHWCKMYPPSEPELLWARQVSHSSGRVHPYIDAPVSLEGDRN